MLSPEFKTGKLERQTKDMEVPLAMCGDMFGPEVKQPVFKLQSLTGPEYYRVQTSAKSNERLKNALEAIQGNESKIKSVVQDLAGQKDNPDEYNKDRELVRYGCVEPDLSDTKALKTFAKNYPMVMQMIANEILLLTGMGGIAKKKP